MTNVIKTVKRTISIKNVFLHSAPCYRELIKQGSLCIRRAGRHTVICCQTKRWSYSKKADKRTVDAENNINLRITDFTAMTPPIQLDKTVIILIYLYQHSKGVTDER